MTATSTLISSADLAKREHVSRATICRWRRVGFLPRAVYADGKTTLWSTADIDDWHAAGCPWSDITTAKQAFAHYGKDELNKLTRPDPWDASQNQPRLTAILDQMESLMNATQEFVVSEADFRHLHDKFLNVRREVALHVHQHKDDDQ